MSLGHHAVYGLSLRSNVSIPGLKELPPAAAPPDLEIHFDMEPDASATTSAVRELIFSSSVKSETGIPTLQIWKVSQAGCLELEYLDGMKFWVDAHGRHVWATWPATLTIDDVAAYLVGPVLGLVLQLRGIACLHASAVAFGDYAVAFAGGDGAGKSTTAAAFACRGHAVISDDVVGVVEKSGSFYVVPAYPHLSLRQDAVELLYGAEKKLPTFSRNLDKRRLALDSNGLKFAEKALPLEAIFILGDRSEDGNAPFVASLTPREALFGLLGNSFAGHLIDNTARARDFELFSRTVLAVPVKRLQPHRDPARIQKLCNVILESCSQR